MKAGFWVAPDGADEALTIMPVGHNGDDIARSTSKISFLATAGAEETIARCPRIAALLPQLAEALRTQRADAPGRLFDLAELDDLERTLLADVLGEGEVAATIALPDDVLAQVQESVMAGLWRVRFSDAGGKMIADYLEVAAIPEAVRRAALMTAPALAVGTPPEGAMNVMPVIAEISERMAAYRPGMANHTITFSLFPMSPADMDFLQGTLGNGPVQIVSRGYGACRVLATGARNVWSVQYFNAMDTIILDTLEIGDVPQAACAAEEDFADSAERLAEIEEAYFK